MALFPTPASPTTMTLHRKSSERFGFCSASAMVARGEKLQNYTAPGYAGTSSHRLKRRISNRLAKEGEGVSKIARNAETETEWLFYCTSMLRPRLARLAAQRQQQRHYLSEEGAEQR
mmetsp:Transcript_25970/g.52944  ORF Transcript_25970/g.52944 Transcript_25970/m.52944 type:complete len:117 (-) Transcript_25970:52-402(-)